MLKSLLGSGPNHSTATLTKLSVGTKYGLEAWAGIAIHDISSVVDASAHYGLDALQTAT
jgi:hypothetical protein